MQVVSNEVVPDTPFRKVFSLILLQVTHLRDCTVTNRLSKITPLYIAN